MKTIIPSDISVTELHQLMLGAIAPRPIALASTIDREGKPNLSPFSFYNAFGVNPTTLIFSPSRRGRDNTVKNTYENVKEVPEVVINAVTYGMVQQVSLASTEYPRGVNEFEKSGLSPLASEIVKPFRVKESPVQFECKVRQVIETGDQGGAANLVICEILLIHVHPDVLNAQGKIDTRKMDLVGRMGADFYVRAAGDALFEVEKPLARLGIGVDNLPDKIRLSTMLTGNDLGRLGNLESLPTSDEIEASRRNPYVSCIISENKNNELAQSESLHRLAQQWIEAGKYKEALSMLMLTVKQ
ncbi:MAG: flavin reductase family protein [Bacteroidales bacterium]|nr:flavin reductase family protein [Bacteroidales bacterium]